VPFVIDIDAVVFTLAGIRLRWFRLFLVPAVPLSVATRPMARLVSPPLEVSRS
jgi:hypothetical protein